MPRQMKLGVRFEAKYIGKRTTNRLVIAQLDSIEIVIAFSKNLVGGALFSPPLILTRVNPKLTLP